MKYQCDTAKECGHPKGCDGWMPHPHDWDCDELIFCSSAGHRVHCHLIPETHTCYYCNHEGPCVNRIHSTEFTAWGRTQEIRYVCDDGDACDERWQALDQEDSLEEQIESIIVEEILNEAPNWNVPPLLTLSGNAGSRATARIMKLIELPF